MVHNVSIILKAAEINVVTTCHDPAEVSCKGTPIYTFL